MVKHAGSHTMQMSSHHPGHCPPVPKTLAGGTERAYSSIMALDKALEGFADALWCHDSTSSFHRKLHHCAGMVQVRLPPLQRLLGAAECCMRSLDMGIIIAVLKTALW